MQIIIPMTGNGSRFVKAGYKDLKPLIKIEDKPIIEWIVKGMYSSDDDFVFVCRKEHIDNIREIKEVIFKIAPNATIVEITDWQKQGNVVDVLKAGKFIDDSKPCIINYCDFYMSWDYENFKREVIKRNCDGAVPCYSGFHPHLLLKDNVYASCNCDENDNLLEIREKFSFENDKTKARHSPGNYYFKSGEIMKHYCNELVKSGQTINGEYYASLPFNFMVKDGLKVWVPTHHVKYFCQWGTPRDMQEWQYWINIMKYLKF